MGSVIDRPQPAARRQRADSAVVSIDQQPPPATSRPSAHFECGRSHNGKFSFSLRVGEGVALLLSKSYLRREACMAAIDSARAHVRLNANLVRRIARDGKHYFVLVGELQQVLAGSPKFGDVAAMEGALARVRAHAPDAPLR